MAYTSLLLVFGAFCAYAFTRIFLSRPQGRFKGSRYPPGPKGTPIVGNLPDIPKKHSWIQFHEWGKKYGPIYRLRLAGREHFVISSEQLANKLLRERARIYSSREQLPAGAKLLSRNMRPLLLPYNETWRNGRKFMDEVANPTAIEQHQPTVILESARMLRDLIRQPDAYEQWFERYSSGVIFRVGFGKRIDTGDEEVVKDIFDVVHNVERVASPGSYLVDTFPFLLYLPKFLAPFKRELDQQHLRELKLFRQLMTDVETDMRRGMAPNCWERDFLRRHKEFTLSRDEAAYLIGTFFEAGSATTTIALLSFLLSMILHLDWFHEIQAEVDLVCGEDRLPYPSDKPLLPKLRAVIKETLRWRPVAAGGVPHQVTQDDEYDGFFIPAGTSIHPNIWSIHRQEDLYPDPDSFRPERWLKPGWPTYREPLSTYPNLRNYSAFGFGRRICPGQNLAEQSLILVCARIAWACDLSKAKNSSGEEITPPYYDYTSGLSAQPKKFPFDLKARNRHRVEVLESEILNNSRLDPLDRAITPLSPISPLVF